MDITEMFEDFYTVVDLLELVNRKWNFVIYDVNDKSKSPLLSGDVYSYLNGDYDDVDEVDYDDFGEPIESDISSNQYDEYVIDEIIVDSKTETVYIGISISRFKYIP